MSPVFRTVRWVCLWSLMRWRTKQGLASGGLERASWSRFRCWSEPSMLLATGVWIDGRYDVIVVSNDCMLGIVSYVKDLVSSSEVSSYHELHLCIYPAPVSTCTCKGRQDLVPAFDAGPCSHYAKRGIVCYQWIYMQPAVSVMLGPWRWVSTHMMEYKP